MTYKVISEENETLVKEMEDFVSSHINSHFLQSPLWRKVKPKWIWRGILAYENGVITGSLSLLIRPLPLGYSIFYSPRGPVCKRNDKCTLSALFDGVFSLKRQFKPILFQLDPDESFENEEFKALMFSFGFKLKEDKGFDGVQPQHVFRLNLREKTEDEIFSAFSSKTRYNIRTALRHDLKMRVYYGDEDIPADALSAFSSLMDETGKRDGFITRDEGYFKALLSSLGLHAVLLSAYRENTPIAGTIFITYGKKSWYLYGASSNHFRNMMPNYLLQWEMIRLSLRDGAVFYDFRGVPGTDDKSHPLYGLYRFKKGFGGDFTKFSGLFSYNFRPILARIFPVLLGIFRVFRSGIRG